MHDSFTRQFPDMPGIDTELMKTISVHMTKKTT